ncbi:MAG TPA: amidohydrolase family protein [Candidatus Binatia bacterium]|nr:amidohydrolase family protein [Candidatus Binatia bacterium]
MPDLVIRDALLCDGGGREAVRGDLAADGGRISALGRVRGRGTTEVDAGGLALAPGFIDVHTHYDCQLFWDPSASPSAWHGVTTVVMGNCGFTIAPCRAADRETLLRLLLFVEGMPIETLRAGVPWGWEDFAGYLAALDRLPLGVNVAPFIGHSAVRLHVMGAAALERAATAEERAAMAAAVRAGMAAGAIGWSTSRSPTHFFGDDGRPAPSRLADEDELLALAAALGDLDRGIIEVAPRTTIGAADDKAEEQRFFARLARASGKVVSWAPLLDNPFAPGSAQRLLAEAAALQAGGAAVVPQVGCRPLELRFDFATATFGLDNNAFWRPIMAEPRAARKRRFADPAFRDELRRFEGGFVAALAPCWDRLFVRLPATPGGRRLQDRSVADIAGERGVPPVDAFCDLVLAEDLETQWGAVVLNGDEDAVAALLRDPAGLLALSDAGAHVDTLSDQGFTTHLLGHWVRERGALALEEAVRLLTEVPARRYGLAGRGRLAPGAAADLVVFDPARVGARPAEMVRDLPCGQRRLIQRADGVEHVFVNGTAVVEHGVPTGRGAGRVLRGGV